jgi:hypothetical protein
VVRQLGLAAKRTLAKTEKRQFDEKKAAARLILIMPQ